MKRWESLGAGGAGIWQDSALGCFTEDSVLLAHFMRIRKNDRVLDIGTGNGVLSIYGQQLYGGNFVGVDTNAEQVSLAAASAERNGQESCAFFVMDAAVVSDAFPHGSFDVCVSNPPYYLANGGAPTSSRALARHAESELLNTFLHTAFLMLKNGGSLFLCYPSERLADVICALRGNRIEPKRMRVVSGAAGPRLLLIEAKKLAKPGLRMEP